MQYQTIMRTVDSLLRGVGQIMLQNNAWTGLVFLAGIFLGSVSMGAAVLLAVAVGTLTAKLFKYDEAEINSGLYGFSAALVGVGMLCFYQSSLMVWLAVIVGSALASILQHFFMVRRIPVFTFPFILIMWLFFFVASYFPTQIPVATIAADQHINDYLSLIAHGVGQVIIQDNLWAGLLFIAGLTIARPVATIYAVLSIIVSSLIAYWLRQPIDDIYLGLLSYNAVLCAITFAGKKSEDGVFGLISVILSVFIMVQMRNLNFPALTFPFVLASWITLLIKSVFTPRFSTPSTEL